ncbi:ABC transporter substrate-binding protein [Haloferax volcanii]|uniref:Peptide ABC transporter substrate-binding protein n=1 Tax=Haloferax volcanii (strain ATCC 29605 / DSM 3757 / JCM 8879 / NBRC 14742 / NCIMB 2012 / VKM B-1768 / DS2) TaxID=309800 RepID=L9VGQ7_HALVD|nr:ABC transporter substrate-binding protein [Haloferax volcanii]ELY36395.1 peptide ABC transporter substrate-binding protein [Haloferax volcanii DS2]MDW7538592.1 ABC transporter substrate-binding protein [Haloferax volcanii]
MGTQWNPDSLDPLVKGWVFRKLSVIEPLVITDYDASVAPGLATDWSATDESRQWEFTLRDDVTFHDGTPLSAALAVESLRRSFASTSLAGLPVESVSAADDRTVRIRTERPFAPLPAHLTRAETSIVSSESYDDDGAVTELIGTGPFRFDSWEPGERITAVAFESYHGTVPSIDELVYERVADEQTRLLKLENGELDMARQLSTETTPGLEAHDHLTAYEYEVPRTRYLVFDTTSTPFGDREVRRAAMYALDRAGIVESVLNGGGPAAVGPYPPELTEWANEDLEPYAYDPEKARELLEAAGWKATESGRVRDGEPLEIELWTYDAWSLPIVAQVVQEQLSAVGFDVSLRQLAYSTIRERANRDSFDAVLWSNSLLWYPDPDRLADFVHSTEATMFSGYENERVDRLLEAARTTTHRAERKRRYDEVQAIAQRDVPIGWVTHVTNVVGTSADVEGYRPLPTETCYHLEDVTHQSRA